jgi:hypothetical protein
MGLLPSIDMGARQYTPRLGRFTETDPVEGGCANDYVYPADPVNVYDLDGRAASACASTGWRSTASDQRARNAIFIMYTGWSRIARNVGSWSRLELVNAYTPILYSVRNTAAVCLAIRTDRDGGKYFLYRIDRVTETRYTYDDGGQPFPATWGDGFSGLANVTTRRVRESYMVVALTAVSAAAPGFMSVGSVTICTNGRIGAVDPYSWIR